MKPKVYTQLYVQLVFAVKHRDSLIHKPIQEKVFGYISGIINGLGHKAIITNGVPDHVHIFLGLNPTLTISDTVREVKRSSSLFINEHHLCRKKFNWQDGYGAFSYGRSQIDTVYNYILEQEKHHKAKTFKEEYLGLLKKFSIEYDDRYLFDFFD